MKKLVGGILMKHVLPVVLIAASLQFISAPVNADQCTVEHPCGTWAVVDSLGIVRNIIVCEERVCGASGAWGGIMPNDTPWPGAKLVLQVPPNPVTNQSQGGNMGTPENPVRYDAQAQVFTQGSSSSPAPVTRSESIDTTTLTATIHSEVVTFGPNSFIDGQMQLTPKVDEGTGATITAVQSNGETRTVTNADGVEITELVLTKQTQSFTTPQTRAQIEVAIQNKLSIIQRYLERFYNLLKGWLKD